MEVGLVGKPNVGKSTFFSALTLAPAEIANYPFTTIEPNRGVGYVGKKCPHVELGVQCDPNNSLCVNDTRLIPVEAIDVAGLVPGAHEGKGLGNKFLDDLRQASALIHIVDASGTTDAEGNACDPGAHNPEDDVDFLANEISMWIRNILAKDWDRVSRKALLTGKKVDVIIHERLTGLGISESHIHYALRETDLPEKVEQWGDGALLDLSRNIRKIGKPIIIAANKMDRGCDEDILQRLEGKGYTVIPTAAEFELALRRAEKAGLIDYTPGAGDFTIKDPSKLNPRQAEGLEKIREFIQKHGSTGIQRCMEKAIFETLDRIAVYPVEDENHYTNKEGAVLPDVYLMPSSSNALDLAYTVHSDIGDGFIRAVDARTKRVIGKDHVLKDGDVITIIAKT